MTSLRLYGAALLSAAAAVQGVFLEGPKATDVPNVPSDAQSPVPTSPPDLKRLLKRAGDTTVYFAPDNTCGWVSGSSALPFTCFDDTASCALITISSSGAIGCCGGSSGGCQGFYLNCIDSKTFYSSTTVCGSSCRSDTLTLKCTQSAAPFCGTVAIHGTAGAQGQVLIDGFYCASTSFSIAESLLTTYNGEKDGRTFSPYVLTSSASGGTATFGGGSTTPTSPASTSPTGPTSTVAPVDNNSSSGPPVGAIVGGVVGGIAVIALGVLAVFFILRKKKNKKPAEPIHPAGFTPGVGPTPSPGPAGGMAQVPPVQPHQSMYGAPPGMDPSKMAGVQSQVHPMATPPPPPMYANQTPPQGYYNAQPPVNRGDATSPLSVTDYSRMSSVSTGSYAPLTGHGPPSALSPQSTGTSMLSPQHTGGLLPGQVPPTIHEAGGNAVGGGQNYQSDHHGEMHELA